MCSAAFGGNAVLIYDCLKIYTNLFIAGAQIGALNVLIYLGLCGIIGNRESMFRRSYMQIRRTGPRRTSVEILLVQATPRWSPELSKNLHSSVYMAASAEIT